LRTINLQKPIRLVAGGRERSDSILNALDAVTDLQPDIVAVHDGVRPFVTSEQITRVIHRAREVGAAILALAATDTIKEVENNVIRRTLDRRAIYRAQTPQAFRYALLRRANEEARAAGLPPEMLTDDSLLVERLGVPVAVVAGSARNLKITTPEDLRLAESLIEDGEQQMEDASRQETSFGTRPTHVQRVGIGNDIHRLVAGRKLILGGIELPFGQGLLGHSDADSLTHAVCDALLGAVGLGDIGTHFSDQDARFAGADSITLLKEVCAMLNERGFAVVNVDATIMAERPKMMPHIPAMRARLAAAIGIDESRISIKAKTNEGLDAVGRGEAIAAQAIALLMSV